jgi:hypothetical protein
MANLLGSNPWYFDTPGGGILYESDVKSAHFEWEGYTGDTDTVAVQDRFGKIVWAATGKTDASLVESFTIEWLHGINVTTLSSGILRLYFK